MSGKLHMIFAIGRNGAIGKNGDLIWKIREDLKRFKSLTMSHPVIMGRKTWDSLPKKPLPGRRNLVLSRRDNYSPEGAEVVRSVEETLMKLNGEKAYVIGGAEIYKAFEPHAKVLDVTAVEEECEDADSFLDIDFSEWELKEESPASRNEDGVSYRFLTFVRR